MTFLPEQLWLVVGNYNSSTENGHLSRTIIFRRKLILPADSPERYLLKFVARIHRFDIQKIHDFYHTN